MKKVFQVDFIGENKVSVSGSSYYSYNTKMPQQQVIIALSFAEAEEKANQYIQQFNQEIIKDIEKNMFDEHGSLRPEYTDNIKIQETEFFVVHNIKVISNKYL